MPQPSKNVMTTMNFAEALKLTNDPLNGCSARQLSRHLWLSPYFLHGKIKTGVKKILDKQLGKFTERLEGIVLAYSNVTLLKPTGHILDDNPNIHFDVQYDIVVFKVRKGALLKCKVNEIASDHLSCLIHNQINLSVPQPKVNYDLKKLKQKELVCQIEEFKFQGGVLALQGKLTDESLEMVHSTAIEANQDIDGEFEDDTIDWKTTEDDQEDGQEGNPSHDSSNSLSFASGLNDMNTVISHKKKKKKDKKKKKHAVDIEDSEDNCGSLEDSLGSTNQASNYFSDSLEVEEVTFDAGVSDSGKKQKASKKRKHSDEFSNLKDNGQLSKVDSGVDSSSFVENSYEEERTRKVEKKRKRKTEFDSNESHKGLKRIKQKKLKKMKHISM